MLIVLFFKQKTAYEMRISDWSSDVCSSDLPDPDGPRTFGLHRHVDDADATIGRATAAGARLLRAPQDHFYGERSGTVRDPFGYDWLIGHSIEEVEPAEMQRRYEAMLAPGGTAMPSPSAAGRD